MQQCYMPCGRRNNNSPPTGVITYYVLFFIDLESRRVCLAGVTRHPNQEWMEQMARNVTMEDSGFLINRRYLLHDRDSKYCPSFRQVIEAGSVKTLALPPRSPNLNAYAERWVRLRRNASRGSSCSESLRCDELCNNTSCITMRSATTRVKRI